MKMKKELWIGLWAISACGALAAGVMVSQPKVPGDALLKTERRVEPGKPDADRVEDLSARLEEIRGAIGDRDRRITELEAEIANARAELSTLLSPEDEKDWRDSLASRRKWERKKALDEKGKTLRKKILQRKDKALQEEGLTELAILVNESKTDEDMALGLRILGQLWQYDFDRERFRPGVLAALENEDPFIRRLAIECARKTVSWEEERDIALRMAKDPSEDVRWWIAPSLGFFSWTDRKEEAAPFVRAYLQDENYMVRWKMLEHLRGFADEMDDLYIKLLDDPQGLEGAMVYSVERYMRTISAGFVQRLAEKFEEGSSERRMMRLLDPGTIDFERPPDETSRWQRGPGLSPEARPILSDLYLRLVRNGLVNRHRHQALEGLRKMGDPSVIPFLDEIRRSPDAEGIEEELAKTIEHLQQVSRQPR
jgi:HEAT repeat protein